MKHRRNAFLLIVSSLISQAWAQDASKSAYGIQVPVRGAKETPPDPSSQAKVDEATGLDVVKSADINGAAAGAAAQAAKPAQAVGKSRFKRIEGASLFEDANGSIGLMVTGVGTYQSDLPNPDARRMNRRSAYVAAYADAMRLLTEKLYGSEVEQSLQILKKLKIEVDDNSSKQTQDTASEEKIKDAMSGLVRGAQIWKCADEGDKVRVWLFVTRESSNACRAISGEVKVANGAGFQSAVDSVIDECLNGFLPPIGGKCVLDGKSGQMTFVGFGSSLILDGALNDLQATKTAQIRAKAGLVAVMTGAQVNYEAYLSSNEKSSIANHKQYGQALPPAQDDSDVAKSLQRKFKSAEEFADVITIATKGKLPPGTQDVAFVDSETGWVTSVYIYTVGSDSLMNGLKGDGSRAGEYRKSPEGSGAAPKPSFDPAIPGPSGQGRDPRRGGL